MDYSDHYISLDGLLESVNSIVRLINTEKVLFKVFQTLMKEKAMGSKHMHWRVGPFLSSSPNFSFTCSPPALLFEGHAC